MSAELNTLIRDIAATVSRPFNDGSSESETARMRVLCAMESEPELDVADMNEAELRACILHDPDVVTRRRALVRWGAMRYAEGCVDQAKITHGVK